MRWVILVLVVLGFAPRAVAGDFDILRGSMPTYHWGGVYGGAQGGYASSTVNFGLAAGPEVAFILRDTSIEQDEQISQWDVLGARDPRSTSLGGFIGYNAEWENLILGPELNYNRVSLSASSSSAIERSFVDSNDIPAGHNYFYTVSVGARSSLTMTDIATLRARAGWQAGNFLPYAFAGLAVGRADVSTAASVSYTAVDYPNSETPPLTPLPNLSYGPALQENGQNGAIAYGVAAGLGVDVALSPNLFVRGEFEYIYFAPLDGIEVSVTSARVGGGIKF